jgi:hypothetical protein
MYYFSPRTPPPAVRSGKGDDGGGGGNGHLGGGNGGGTYAEPPEWRADPRGAVVGLCRFNQVDP